MLSFSSIITCINDYLTIIRAKRKWLPNWVKCKTATLYSKSLEHYFRMHKKQVDKNWRGLEQIGEGQLIMCGLLMCRLTAAHYVSEANGHFKTHVSNPEMEKALHKILLQTPWDSIAWQTLHAPMTILIVDQSWVHSLPLRSKKCTLRI